MPPDGINELCENDKLIIYPNPSYEELNIQISGTYNNLNEIVIYDALGQIVFESEDLIASDNLLSINTSGFCKGIYYIKLIQNNKTITVNKWIKVSN